MAIANFSDLLLVAGQQSCPQRMLFVFVKTTTQRDYSAEQLASFEAGEGGALMPLFCVDLSQKEVTNFAHLTAEADKQSPQWDKVLVACTDDVGLTKGAIDTALQTMVGRVETGGDLTGYLCFARNGSPVIFSETSDA